MLGHLGWFLAMRLMRDGARFETTGYVILGLMILALALLLGTTPHDALRFPRARSDRLIVVGTVLLYLAAALIVPSAVSAMHVSIACAAALVTALLLLRRLRAGGGSAWLTVLFAWNPLVVFQAGVMGRAALMGAVMLLVGVVANVWTPRAARRELSSPQ